MIHYNELRGSYFWSIILLPHDFSSITPTHRYHTPFVLNDSPPAIPAFETEPRLHIGECRQLLQTVTSRTDSTTSARREYEAIVSQLCIRRGMSAASPNKTIVELTTVENVLVHREKRDGEDYKRSYTAMVMFLWLWKTKVESTYCILRCLNRILGLTWQSRISLVRQKTELRTRFIPCWSKLCTMKNTQDLLSEGKRNVTES